MYMKLNDIVVNDRVVIPVIARSGVSAVNLALSCNPSGWDSNFWDLHDWFKDV
jgi:peptide/nickel transport system substrate-binding protein